PAALDELPGFLAGHLAPEQIPGRIHQVDVMPRSANGKVLKHVLRDRLTGRAG
ncbi:fatty-acyl-CoA synthase, partial [Streptomyces sp. Termitarium-T10T-6]